MLQQQLSVRKCLHLEIAVEDFGSNPMMRESMVTNIPPPPTPPTVPNADPRNPIIVPVTILHPNSMSCKFNHPSSSTLILLNKINQIMRNKEKSFG